MLKSISICSPCEKDQKLYCQCFLFSFETGLGVGWGRIWLFRSPDQTLRHLRDVFLRRQCLLPCWVKEADRAHQELRICSSHATVLPSSPRSSKADSDPELWTHTVCVGRQRGVWALAASYLPQGLPLNNNPRETELMLTYSPQFKQHFPKDF